MKVYLVYFIMFVLFVLSGCSIGQKGPPKQDHVESTPSASLDFIEKYLDEKNLLIRRSAETTLEELRIVERNVSQIMFLDDDVFRESRPFFETIQSSIVRMDLLQTFILDSTKEQEEKLVEMAESLKRVVRLERELAVLRSGERALREEAIRNMRKYITMFFVVGFSTTILGGLLIFLRSGKIGSVVLLIGFLMIGLAVGSQFYLETIAAIGIWVVSGGLLLAAGFIGWEFYDNRNNEVAIEEIVELFEAAKLFLTEEQKQSIFGYDGLAEKFTSKKTKIVIGRIRAISGFDRLHDLEDKVKATSRTTGS